MEASRPSDADTTGVAPTPALAELAAAYHGLVVEHRESERRLAAELDAAVRLQELSTRLIGSDHVRALYEQMVDGARGIMHADCASLQMLRPDGALELLAWREFHPESARFWQLVTRDSASSCGEALKGHQRTFVADTENCGFLAGTEDLDEYRRSGIRAVQSTPLISRSGALIGMISTHWRRPHQALEAELRRLDVLARQAADLVERTQAEAALRASQEALTERTTELEAANARLRQGDRRKDEFLAMLGHELRNPIGVVATAVQLMKTRHVADGVVEKSLAAAERQVAHVTRLVDELLDVARITQGKISLRKEELWVAEIVEAAVEATRAAIDARKHQLYVSVTPAVRISGDRVRLAQVVGNLLNNAAKYTPSGGDIYLRTEHRNGHAIITVRDTGQGIAPELLPSVFDLFVQGERSADREQGGLGVGLTLARRLVEMHDGRLEAANCVQPSGAEFTVSLPVLGVAPPQDAAVDSRREAVRIQARRILVVDDAEDATEMLVLLLQGEGHEVMAANNGTRALELACAWRPDVMLLDIGMPGMDGYEVARRLRANRQLAGTVLVALTGYGQEEDVEKSIAAGFNHHQVKPVTVESLREILAKSAGAGNRH